MGEAQTKVSSINVEVLLARHVYFLASRAVDLDTRGAQLLGQADWQHDLAVAEDALAGTEHAKEELLSHEGQPAWRQDEARMD